MGKALQEPDTMPAYAACALTRQDFAAAMRGPCPASAMHWQASGVAGAVPGAGRRLANGEERTVINFTCLALIPCALTRGARVAV